MKQFWGRFGDLEHVGIILRASLAHVKDQVLTRLGEYLEQVKIMMKDCLEQVQNGRRLKAN